MSRSPIPALAVALAVTLAAASAAAAQPPLPNDGLRAKGLPGPLREVGFEQRLGEAMPAGLELLDHEGRPVRLDDLLGERPLVLAPVYFDCPMLCTMVLNGLVQTLKTLDFSPGTEFDVVAFSFDHRELPAEAARVRSAYLRRFGRPGTEGGWHFLTADEATVERLTEGIGFRFAWDEAGGQFAHAAGLVVVAPDGRIARYLFGVEYPARDLRLALVEAADRRIGSAVDDLLLYCYRYDPETGSYSAAVMNLVRAAGGATALGVGLFLVVSLRRERRGRSPR